MDVDGGVVELSADERRACELRNVMLSAQAAIGGSIRWGKWNAFVGEPTGAAVIAYLNPSFREWWAAGKGGTGRLMAHAVQDEAALLDGWEAGDHPPAVEV
jgi:hypothetical protein